VLLKYIGILGFGAQVCLLAIWSFTMAENEIYVIEGVGGIDEVLLDVSTNLFRSHNFSNVESVHQQQCDNDLPVIFDEVYPQAMDQQALLWKPHLKTSIC
jgi:hypothetical protein